MQIAPPLDERAFQILGVESGAVARAQVALDAGIRKKTVRVELPQEEHHQTSDLEQLAAAAGIAAADMPLDVIRTLPSTLREAKARSPSSRSRARPSASSAATRAPWRSASRSTSA